jgi:ribosome biogenesis GTPase A
MEECVEMSMIRDLVARVDVKVLLKKEQDETSAMQQWLRFVERNITKLFFLKSISLQFFEIIK